MNKFTDRIGREIKVGDVLANGQRQGMHGGITIGVVRGFTEKKIVVDALVGDERSHETHRYTTWELAKTYFNADYNCFITGLTEDQLRSMVTIVAE